jgi:hypothetical protein
MTRQRIKLFGGELEMAITRRDQLMSFNFKGENSLLFHRWSGRFGRLLAANFSPG